MVRQKLSPTQLELFRKTCLGHLLDLKELSFSGNLVHKMLLHEVVTEGVEKEMWFLVGGSTVRFSHVEFELVTGLTFGPYPSDTTESTRLRDMYFGGQTSMELKDLQEAYKAIDFRLIDDLDAVKLSLYVLMDLFLLGRGQRYHTDMWILQMVDDLEQFNRFSWGSVVWTYTFRSLSKVMARQLSTYKVKQAQKRKKGLKHVNRYNLCGFPFAFQPPSVIRIMEASATERALPYGRTLQSDSAFGGEYAGSVIPEQAVSSHSPRTPMEATSDDDDAQDSLPPTPKSPRKSRRKRARHITVSEEAPKHNGLNYSPTGHDSFRGVSSMDRSPPPPSAGVPGPSESCSDISQEIRALRADFIAYTERQEEMWRKHEDILRRQEELLHRQDQTLTVLVKELAHRTGSDSAQDSQV
ncbi:Phospholipase-like protein [Melia azedarach]|uniref:Phospholipase-like protein n=1 Tax=Melia azedarach TaxID=155640 RepID=A0ACC1X8S6_MELAZ|nr:Phospholipase-like protein [Melia azedarach]